MKKGVTPYLKTVLLVVPFVLFYFPQLGRAQAHSKVSKTQLPPPHKAAHIEHLATKFGLEGKVKEKVIKLFSDFHEKKASLHLKVEQLKQQLAEILREEPIPMDKVKAKLQELAKAKEEIMTYKITLLGELKKIVPIDKYNLIKEHLIKRWVLKHGDIEGKCGCGCGCEEGGKCGCGCGCEEGGECGCGSAHSHHHKGIH